MSCYYVNAAFARMTEEDLTKDITLGKNQIDNLGKCYPSKVDLVITHPKEYGIHDLYETLSPVTSQLLPSYPLLLKVPWSHQKCFNKK